MKKKKSKTREIRDTCNEILNQISHNLTKSQYKQIVRRYVEYCRSEFNVQTFDECKGYIQAYCDYLQEKSYTPSTIHTYISGVCKCWNVPLKLIDKPIRHMSEYSKGRSRYKDKYRSDEDLLSGKHHNLVAFQSVVGIRRSELMKLKKENFIQKDGKYFVEVLCGKGGKDSLVYIEDKDVPLVRKYFDRVKEGEYIFAKEEFANSLNLHFLRAERAKILYKNTVLKLQNNPQYRKGLEQFVREYWRENNFSKKTGKPKPFPEKSIHGTYILRGSNRSFAIKNKLPYVYDRLALKFVSMVALCHFREDITCLYLLYT